MKRKPKRTAAELAQAVSERAPPRSQAEWREASTAMRTARRAAGPGREWDRTIEIECGSPRRRLTLWGHNMSVYNGPSRFSYIAMIGFSRRRYIEGCKARRVQDAREFAAASRADGAVPLP
jgi:hypothetical protein